MQEPVTAEKRGFQMHPELLRSVIKKQAGTVEKAILEGVMNSIDAGSSRCEVSIMPYNVTITDDGKGFVNREEIELFFETFGHPHKEGDAKYGKFRMGRGQMFAFGKNVWRTGEFRMTVDINECIGYDLEEGLAQAQGCAIDINLYEPLGSREIAAVVKEISKMVRYVDADVLVNGAKVNTPPREPQFPQTIEEAYIRVTDGHSLDVYNLGVFVRSYPKHTFGCAGVVISRQQLDVNFARNDVLRSCPVWTRIRKFVDATGVTRIKGKPKMNDEERVNIIDRITSTEMSPHEARNLRIFVDTSGKAWSAQAIIKGQFSQFSVAPAGDMVADRLTATGQCLVLDAEWLSLFGCPPAEVFEKFNFFGYTAKPPRYLSFASARQDLSSDCIPLPRHLWTPTEFMWVIVADRIARHLAGWSKARDVRVGDSNVTDAWTDGQSHVTLTRDYLKGLKLVRFDLPHTRDLTRLGLALAEMLCYDEDSRNAGHTAEFYKAYMDMVEKVPFAVAQGEAYLSPANFIKLKKRAENEAKMARKAAGAPETTQEDAEQSAVSDEVRTDEAEREAEAEILAEAPAAGEQGGGGPLSLEAAVAAIEAGADFAPVDDESLAAVLAALDDAEPAG